MKTAWPALAILLLLQAGATASAYAQQSQQGDAASIADAARRSREQKRETQKDQGKAAKVWDNDTIPSKPGAISVVGQTAAASPDDAAADAAATGAVAASGASGDDKANASASGTAAASEKSDASKVTAEIAAIQSDLASARNQLQTAKADLDILQRKFTLDSRTYYGKPNYAADKDGAASLDAEKAEVDEKQRAVADAQMKVEQLEAKLSAVR